VLEGEIQRRGRYEGVKTRTSRGEAASDQSGGLGKGETRKRLYIKKKGEYIQRKNTEQRNLAQKESHNIGPADVVSSQKSQEGYIIDVVANGGGKLEKGTTATLVTCGHMNRDMSQSKGKICTTWSGSYPRASRLRKSNRIMAKKSRGDK